MGADTDGGHEHGTRPGHGEASHDGDTDRPGKGSHVLHIGADDRYLEWETGQPPMGARHSGLVDRFLIPGRRCGQYGFMPSSPTSTVPMPVDETPTQPGLWAPRSAPTGHDPSNWTPPSNWFVSVLLPAPEVTRMEWSPAPVATRTVRGPK